MEEVTDEGNDDTFPWHLGVFDAHCHPTDTMSSIQEIQDMKASALTIMATRAQDQDLVERVSHDLGIRSPSMSQPDMPPQKIVPSFGLHPWFSHQLYNDNLQGDKRYSETLEKADKVKHYQQVLTPSPDDVGFLSALPDPRPLSQFIAETKKRLAVHPFALVGEVGLDRGFRIPYSWLPGEVDQRDESLTPGGREGRQLSPYRVDLDHQRQILLAQLRLAAQMQRAVSMHGVQAHGSLYDTIRETWKGKEKPVISRREQKRREASDAQSCDLELNKDVRNQPSDYPPRICMHSYSGPVDFLNQYLNPAIPVDVFFSFSIAINFPTAAASKTEDVIHALPGDRILVESDLHIAGDRMDHNLEAMVRKICHLKGWKLSEGVVQLAENWKAFVFGKID